MIIWYQRSCKCQSPPRKIKGVFGYCLRLVRRALAHAFVAYQTPAESVLPTLQNLCERPACNFVAFALTPKGMLSHFQSPLGYLFDTCSGFLSRFRFSDRLLTAPIQTIPEGQSFRGSDCLLKNLFFFSLCSQGRRSYLFSHLTC